MDHVEANCAVVRLSDNIVQNTIMAQPSDLAPDGCFLVEIMNGYECNIGWTFEGQFGFIAPSEPPVAEYTPVEVNGGN